MVFTIGALTVEAAQLGTGWCPPDMFVGLQTHLNMIIYLRIIHYCYYSYKPTER